MRSVVRFTFALIAEPFGVGVSRRYPACNKSQLKGTVPWKALPGISPGRFKAVLGW